MGCSVCEDYLSSYPIWFYRETPGWDKHRKADFCPNCGVQLGKTEPLTLEQLREMSGEPVWIESIGNTFSKTLPRWAIAEIYNILNDNGKIECECFRTKSGRGLRISDYGDKWVAYAMRTERR